MVSSSGSGIDNNMFDYLSLRWFFTGAGDGYNPESVEATIEDGLLTVFVPNFKKQEKKRISIL